MKLNRLLIVAAATAMLVSCGKKGNMQFGDNEFPVATVERASSDMQTTFPAVIKGVQDVEIRPKISGFITQVCVREGQSVGAGQLLFVIDNVTYQAAVRQAQAAVNTAQAQVNTAKLTYDNTKQLHENKVVGDYELQTARNTYESARAQLAQAQAALASAKETLSFCYVKSPTSGVVGSLPYKVGTLASASSAQPLTTVSNISSMEVYFSMTEKDVLAMTKTSGSVQQAIASMPEIRLQLADGTVYNQPGHVTKMSGMIDAATGSVSMIARFPNPQRLLKSGGSGSVIIPTRSSNTIIVPQSVVSEVQDKLFIYVVGKDNKVKYTEITVAPQNDGKNYVVTSGLKTGDKYVTNGITKLSDGMEIVPITPERYQQKIDEQAKEMSAGDIVGAMKK
ncbi:MAG: efflux RND transporter periplasmic adaptor subunit [Prevotella sp.]|nr:efflux RND transporter periplasmic adaptor subunit [Prevotella sp.]MDY6230686.1 efflux RND transporter periplasmic adaptor subunit [Prevotella sp.]